MKAIILAAGQGIRLGNNFNELPKCLLKIGNKTILEKQLETLKNVGVIDISIVIGAKGDCWTQRTFDRINNLCEKVILNFDNDITLNAFSTYLGFRYSKEDDILIMDGDLVYNDELLDKIISSKYENIMVTKAAGSRKEIGCRLEVDHNDKLIKIGKNIIDIKFPWHINSGILKIGEKSYDSFYEQLKDQKYIGEELDAPIREFIKYYCINILKTSDKEWININTQNDLKKAIDLFFN